jgi:serine protease Do
MKALKIRYIITALVIVLSLLVSSCSLLTNDNTTPTDTPSPGITTPIDINWTGPVVDGETSALPSIADVVTTVNPSVVAITTEYTSYDIFNRPYEQQGAGSGWIIDEDGIIVTNNHVVEGAESVNVALADGRTFPAVPIRTDSLSDLAVVKVDAQNLPAAQVGNSDALRVGDWVIAIGNSLGLGISATKGIVSAKGVSLLVSEEQTMDDLVQTDAAINPGNSGGPLVNMAGEVIGITSVKVAQVGVEGMGYAISSNSATPIIQQLVQTGYVIRPFLGVQNLLTVDPNVAAYYSLDIEQGALIRGVMDGGPAGTAGLEAGDVIIGFNGQEVTNVNELLKALYACQIEQRVEITYWRDNSQHTAYVTLAESPPS